MLGNIVCFLSSADFYFQKLNFSKKHLFRNTIKLSNSLDPDQAQHFVEPDLGLNSLQRLSAGDTSRERLNFAELCFVVTVKYNMRLLI